MANDVGEIIKNITEDVKVLVRGEIELAKAELIPSGKNAGVGAGFFGAAGYLALNAASLIFLALSALIGWLFYSLLNISYLPAFAIGFAIMAVLLLVVAGILAMMGKAKLKKINGPERTVAQGKAAVDDVKGAVERGQNDVESGEALERHLDQKALVTGSPRHAADVTVRPSHQAKVRTDGWISADDAATARTGGSHAADEKH